MEEGARRLTELRINSGLSDKPYTRLSAAIREKVESGEEPVLRDPEALASSYQPAADLLEVIDRLLLHIRAKEPGGSRFVPLIGHRDYGIAGAGDPEAFDHALGQGVELGYVERKGPSEAAYRITPAGLAHLRTTPARTTTIKRIFLSHAALDKPVALVVRDELVRLARGLDVFVASRPGDIRADEDWLPVIQREIRAADAYCVLLTPNSSGRPWVWFETGAAWMSGKKWVVARAQLAPELVPLPLSSRQTYAVDDPQGAREVFRALDVELPNAPEFAEHIGRLMLQPS
jgi:hypothetical protein